MLKIPYSCIECDFIEHEAICGIYNDRFMVVNTDRSPPECCPLRQLNRFEWLCSNTIKEVVHTSDNSTEYSYIIEFSLKVNNSIISSIDHAMKKD